MLSGQRLESVRLNRSARTRLCLISACNVGHGRASAPIVAELSGAAPSALAKGVLALKASQSSTSAKRNGRFATVPVRADAQNGSRGNQTAAQNVVFVGDIGGTNARLSAWELIDDPQKRPRQIFSRTYPTANYPTFETVLEVFMREPELGDARAGAACFAVAGAVDDNRCAMTNLNWVLDGEALTQRYGYKVQLLNDFEAVGHGIPALDHDDLVTINNVRVKPKAPKVVMGPGTGLGTAQLMWDDQQQGYKVWAGEGAHATFAPRGWKQQALSMYVTNKFGYCEIEQVACGSGIQLIYEFLKSDLMANRPNVLKQAKVLQSPAEITAHALDGSDSIAEEAVDMFLAIVGAEAGAMALRALARGGVYIAGGITPKLMSRVAMGGMLDGFVDLNGRPRFHQLLQEIPLFVIVNEHVGQIGAREVAARLLSSSRVGHGLEDRAGEKVGYENDTISNDGNVGNTLGGTFTAGSRQHAPRTSRPPLRARTAGRQPQQPKR